MLLLLPQMPLIGAAARAGPMPFDLPLFVPPVIADSLAPSICTVTYLIADVINNDLYAARMQIEPGDGDAPVDGGLPCPAVMPPRVGRQALDVCIARTGEAKACVFADMGRGFEGQADIRNTAENASRCASDAATDIGVACWMPGGLAVCNVGCGRSPAQAMALAAARCAAKQQQSCPITATVPVAEPSGRSNSGRR